MIKNSGPLSIAESMEFVKGNEAEIEVFMKKFSKLKPKEAKELRKKIIALNLMKLNETHVTKIIDLMPETAEELNKIFVDVGLDEDETKKILGTIKEFK